MQLMQKQMTPFDKIKLSHFINMVGKQDKWSSVPTVDKDIKNSQNSASFPKEPP